MRKAEIDAAARRARKSVFPMVKAKIQDALPEGWDMVLAVGWGVTVRDEDGKHVPDRSLRHLPRSHNESTHTMSAKVARAVSLAEHLGDIFWLENEVIEATRSPHKSVR